MQNNDQFSKRYAVIIGILMLTAVIHIVRLGSYLTGAYYRLYYSYFSDFILPFVFYFLLCGPAIGIPLLRRWETKLVLAFVTPAIAETSQYFGVPALGVTFDPLDYLMYGLGAISAVIVDIRVFPRVFRFWRTQETEK